MKDTSPFFSIILPTYNREKRISKAIESVLSQTFDDFELVIVDDGSTDDTEKIVSLHADNRIVYVYQSNSERSAARNNGIKRARGKYICFLDSDDYYLENHLESLFRLIEKNEFRKAMYSTGTISLNEMTGIAIGRPLRIGEKLHPVHYIWKSFLLPDSVCIHKEILEENQFDIRFHIWEDTHLWLRIAARYPFFQCNNYTAIQVLHPEGTVEQNFSAIKIETVDLYIEAIEDLFLNYKKEISPYLTDQDKNNYILNEIYVFVESAYRNQQYKIVFQLYNKAYNIHRSKKMYSMNLCRLCLKHVFK